MKGGAAGMLSVVLAVIIFVLLMVANKWLFTKRGGIPFGRWLEAAIIGGVVGIVNYASPMIHGSPWAVILFLGMLAVYVWLCFSWKQEGSEAKEVIPYIIVALLMYLTCESAAWAVAPLITEVGIKSFVVTLPLIAMVGSIGYMVYNLLNFHHGQCLREEDGKRAGRFKIAKAVVAVITVILLVAALVSGVAWDGFSTSQDPQVEEEIVVDSDISDMDAVMTWYRFYHYDLLGGNLEDDFNFGPSAYSTSTTAMVAKEEHFKRVEEDPALGCATFAAFDVRLGTDFMMPGQHYDQDWSDGYWTTLINERIQYYMANPSSYDVAVERWETFVNKYANVTLSYQKGLTDQMYMVSLTSSSELEAPEVIIAYTDQPDGHILNYEFKIKGNLFGIPFRTECGLQPTNVATVMKETPKSNPVKTTATTTKPASSRSSSSSSSSGNGLSSTVSSSGGSSTVSNSGSSSKEYNKDKTQGVQGDLVKPNDNPGPGPNTNNGVGAWYSTEDQVENSNHMSSYSEYEDTVDKLEEINQNQRRGGDSNTPTTKPADTTNDKTTVDNNADRGTGNGGVDSATPVSKPATEAETNKAINDSPGEAWGGPPD